MYLLSYIDITFLKIQKFLVTDKEIEVKLNTIAKMIRGVSHPFICFYISMYLARIGVSTYPKLKNYLLILVDHLAKFKLNEELIKKFSKLLFYY